MTHIGKIQPVDIVDEMQKSYLDYAMSVIVSRALPDVRDGLKPVHRRILYAMKEMGLTAGGKFTKSAKVVGETMGKFHPHGDMAIYDALVRMAQDFSMRYPLVNGQGNFGSIDGDSAAAMRYTEVKPEKITHELLAEIDKNTVEFRDNFDGSLKEPVFLPTKIPNLLIMGADGIAVGMATKIPPHNISEVCDALLKIIDLGQSTTEPIAKNVALENLEAERLAGKFESRAELQDILEHIKGPDFPTGGHIYDSQAIAHAYATGKASIPLRADTEIVQDKKQKWAIIVNELPYQVNKSRLIKKIADLVKTKKLINIADLRDESDRKGMRIYIGLKRSGNPKATLNKLFKYTDLQTSYPINMVVLINGVPQLCSLRLLLIEFIKHRQLVVIKRSQYDLIAARKREHILEGLMIALKNLDAVIETIKKSKDTKTAQFNLMNQFKLTEIQAQAILDMQLKRLAALERQKIDDEYKQIKETIINLTNLLSNPQRVLEVIKDELREIKEKYGDKRRTKVHQQALGNFNEQDLVPSERVIITMTRDGYIKRMPTGTYRTQRRGGKGVSGMTKKSEDEVIYLNSVNTHDTMYFFTDKGRVFGLKAYELPQGTRHSKGQAIINLLQITQDENITAVLSSNNNKATGEGYFLMVTDRGVVKKTPKVKFKNLKANGLIAIRLDKNDQLRWVKQTEGQSHVLLTTYKGKSIKFSEEDVRPIGRTAKGVRGITLNEGDRVIGMEVFPHKKPDIEDRRRTYFRDLLTITEKGIGKRTPIDDFPLQKRGGKGVLVAKLTPKTGNLAAVKLVDQNVEQIVITSKQAQVIKLPLRNIKQLKRNTQGVILMRLSSPNDNVAAIACLNNNDKNKDDKK